MKTVASLIVIALLSSIMTSCSKEKLRCSFDVEFCTFIDASEFHETGVIIDKFLAGQKKSLSDDEKLEELRQWLECKSCVSSAEIICNSCIYTLKQQSELKVSFIVEGQEVIKVLDIIMDESLQYVRYHE